MSDISMCNNALCPSKDYCYRFTAIPNPTSKIYTGFGPEEDEINCSYFYPNSKDSNKCKHHGVTCEGDICNAVNKLSCKINQIKVIF